MDRYHMDENNLGSVSVGGGNNGNGESGEQRNVRDSDLRTSHRFDRRQGQHTDTDNHGPNGGYDNRHGHIRSQGHGRRSNSEATSRATQESEDEIRMSVTSRSSPHRANMRTARLCSKKYPQFIQEQLRTIHSNVETLAYTRQTLERIEDIRLESRNLLTQLWHQHVFLMPDALRSTVQATNETSSVRDSLPEIMGSGSSDMSPMDIDSDSTAPQNVERDVSVPSPPPSSNDRILKGIDYNEDSRYEGEFNRHNVREGNGTYFYPSGTVYRGQWSQGSRHGLGVCEFSSGNRYIGYWNHGRREGRGIFLFTRPRSGVIKTEHSIPGVREPRPAMLNAFEQGKYEADIMARFGDKAILRISSGNARLCRPSSSQDMHVSQPIPYEHRQRQYQGLELSSTGLDIRSIRNVFEVAEMIACTTEPEQTIRTTLPRYDISCVPEFVATDPQLLSTIQRLLLFGEQERYEGEFHHDQRHGFGVYYFSDGCCYAGMWKSNRRHGKGTYLFASGRVYEGDWRGSTRHGNGVMRDADGHVTYAGQWVNDRKHGIGTQYENGDWITAIWCANKIEKLLSVELFPLRLNLMKFLIEDCISDVNQEEAGHCIGQVQDNGLSIKHGDPQQQDLEPPDILSSRRPFQSFFQDVTIITYD